jgi:hypothetical protein
MGDTVASIAEQQAKDVCNCSMLFVLGTSNRQKFAANQDGRDKVKKFITGNSTNLTSAPTQKGIEHAAFQGQSCC